MKKETAKKNNVKKTTGIPHKAPGSEKSSGKAPGKAASKAAITAEELEDEMHMDEVAERGRFKEKGEEEGSELAAELEDTDEEQEAAAASSNQGNAAALAAANGHSEMSASFKNFRHHPDMENFYRFIFENDLRQEALGIIDHILTEKQQRKNIKPGKAAH